MLVEHLVRSPQPSYPTGSETTRHPFGAVVGCRDLLLKVYIAECGKPDGMRVKFSFHKVYFVGDAPTAWRCRPCGGISDRHDPSPVVRVAGLELDDMETAPLRRGFFMGTQSAAQNSRKASPAINDARCGATCPQ